MKNIFFLIIFSYLNLFGKPPYFSQYNQDQIVNEVFFKDKYHGVFVDIGAHNGIRLSNTYFFEKNLNWRGICIEPIPEVFYELRKNRSCICIKGCISDTEKEVEFCRIHGYGEMLSGIIKKYNSKHIKRINSLIKQKKGYKETIHVQTYCLINLLDEFNLHEIDFLSIDTEGGEFDILKSINFEKVKISVITIESNGKEKEIIDFLHQNNFKLYRSCGPDLIFYNLNVFSNKEVKCT